MDLVSTIVAVASPPGTARRGVVRLSGDEVGGVLAALGAAEAFASGRGMHRARLALPAGPLPCFVLVAPGPASYTGEDTAEIHTAGNEVLLAMIVDTALAAGAGAGLSVRRAEAGEFTARAFLHGRLGLTAAEGVAATIAARSDAELTAARDLMGGRLDVAAAAVVEDLAGLLAGVEAGIDFTDEEDVVAVSVGAIRAQVASVRVTLNEAVGAARAEERGDASPWVALVGPPNAGKSTLFNALLGRTRAVATDIAGTTRDVLVEPLELAGSSGPLPIMLVDTAGTVDSRTAIERAAQELGSAARRRADLRVICTPMGGARRGVLDADGAAIEITTMADRPGTPGTALAVSGRTGRGLDELRRAIIERLEAMAAPRGAESAALLPRHRAALASASAELEAVLSVLAGDGAAAAPSAPELVSAHMRLALDAVGTLCGAVTPDDVLGRIFASFCIGK